MTNLRTEIEKIIFTWEDHGTMKPWASSKDLVDKLESLVKEEARRLLAKMVSNIRSLSEPEFKKEVKK